MPGDGVPSLRRVRPQQIELPSLMQLDTLEDVLRAGYDVLEVVVQDEYTHDVVCTRRGEPGYTVFDTT